MSNPIYSSPLLFNFVMRLKFGSTCRERLRRAAAEVRPGMRVIDLCAGDAMIYRSFLRRLDVDYTGYEINGRMVRSIRRRGVRMIQADVRTMELPPADVIMCLSSLYQFPDHAEALIRRALDVAPTLVLLEPIENLASSRFAPLAALAARLSDFGEGPVAHRFDETGLRERFERLDVTRIERIGPELLAVWRR